MTIGKKQDGTLIFELSAKETADFLSGKSVVKVSGDARGEFRVTVKLTRRRR